MKVHFAKGFTCESPAWCGGKDGARSTKVVHVTCMACVYKFPDSLKEQRLRERRIYRARKLP